MLSQQQKDRLAPEVLEAIMSPTSDAQRRKLHMIWKIVTSAPTDQRRQKLFRYFERVMSKELKPFVVQLHSVSDQLSQ